MVSDDPVVFQDLFATEIARMKLAFNDCILWIWGLAQGSMMISVMKHDCLPAFKHFWAVLALKFALIYDQPTPFRNNLIFRLFTLSCVIVHVCADYPVIFK